MREADASFQKLLCVEPCPERPMSAVEPVGSAEEVVAKPSLAPLPDARGASGSCSRTPRGPRKTKIKGLPRQVADAETALARKLGEMRAALAERERLQKKLGVLEVVLPSLDAAFHALSLASGGSAPASSKVGAQFVARDDGSDDALEALLQDGLDVFMASGDLLDDAELLALPLETDFGTDDTPQVDAAACSASVAPAQLPADLTLASARQIIAREWSAAVKEMGFLLSVSHVRPDASVDEAGLQVVWDRLTLLMRTVGMAQPDAWFSLIGVNLLTGQRDDVPPRHWQGVLAACQLTERQEANIKACMAFHDERMQRIMDERRELKSRLTYELAVGGGASSPAYEELALQLRANIRSERFSRMSVMVFISQSPDWGLVQNARCNVASWPYVPDTFAICSWMGHQDPGAQPQAAAGQAHGG